MIYEKCQFLLNRLKIEKYVSHILGINAAFVKCSTEVQKKFKPNVTLDNDTDKLIRNDELKPRKHDGRVYRPTIALPKWVLKAMNYALEGHSRDAVLKDSMDLHRHLAAKSPPPEKGMIESKYMEISENVQNKLIQEKNGSEEDDIAQKVHNQTLKQLKSTIAPWAPIQYDAYRSLMYMLARGAQDYAILHKILAEIQSRDRTFKPKTLFDFGSGIGTVSWVASEIWRNSLKERMCIDVSTDINDLAEKLIKDADPKIRSVAFHRQYLPVTSVPTFDIVVSAFTLLELPNRKMRIDTLANLWRKTGKYLVLVEYGTKGGFQVISEARDFLIQLINVKKIKDQKEDGFILSPCPHDLDCPRRATDDNACKFETGFFEITFGKRLVSQTERYTYVVFRKGAQREEKDFWPRIVRPVIRRSGHSICRMCTAEGKLQEIIFSKSKHERPVYYCARSSRWGDRLPIKIETVKEV